mmetsp:Transcript_3469/g.9244  ORF Transcript_3469/g.9244 Transcript_3469/m.9244 type:complete len:250 (-) Transcript_3469:86-835(-)
MLCSKALRGLRLTSGAELAGFASLLGGLLTEVADVLEGRGESLERVHQGYCLLPAELHLLGLLVSLEEHPQGCRDAQGLKGAPQLAPVASHALDDLRQVLQATMHLAPDRPAAGPGEEALLRKGLGAGGRQALHLGEDLGLPLLEARRKLRVALRHRRGDRRPRFDGGPEQDGKGRIEVLQAVGVPQDPLSGDGGRLAPAGALTNRGAVPLQAIGVGDVQGDAGVQAGQQPVVDALLARQEAHLAALRA